MLRWVFTADTGPYRKGLAQMRTETKAFTGSVTRMFGGVFAGGAIAAGFAKWLQHMDRLDRAATKLGANVEDLQRAELVGEKSGVRLEQLTNLLVRMKRRLGEAAQGSETYRKRLDSLGLSQEALEDAQPTEFLLALSRAWHTATLSGTAYADLLGLLDSEAREIVPILEEGPKKLAQQFKQASVVGEDTTKKVADLNKRLAEMKNVVSAGFGYVFSAIGSIGDSLGAQLGFLINMVMILWRELKNGAAAALQTINGILNRNLDDIKEGAAGLGNALGNSFSDIVKEAKAGAQEIGDSWRRTFGMIEEEAEKLKKKLTPRERARRKELAQILAEEAQMEREDSHFLDKTKGPKLRATKTTSSPSDDLAAFEASLDGVFGPSARERQRRREMLEFSRLNGLRTELDPDDSGNTLGGTPGTLTVSRLRSIGGVTASFGAGAHSRSLQAQSVSLLTQIADNTRPRDAEGGPPSRPPRG